VTASIDANALERAFAAPSPPTLGLEEEVLLLDPATLDLAPVADAVLARLGGDPRFTRELPAGQVEIVVPPAGTVAESVAALGAARAHLARATAGVVELATAGLHPFTAAEGELNPGPRYDATAAEYGVVARRQLVCALQVHVAIRGRGRTLPVYNALRSYLPELAALAANAPFHDGRDTGLASARPTIGGQLPRQGVPPALASWAAYAEALSWTGDPGRWWWELRPHPRHGTLEFRVPDAQTTIRDAAAIAAVAQSLAVWLGDRHDAGETVPAVETWRIEENRWSACRHGVQGEMRDLRSGRAEPTRARLHRLLDSLEATARDLGCAVELDDARRLVQRNGAMAMREAADGDPLRATRWLSEQFLAGVPADVGATPAGRPG
jgi:carboxylate-amine ligase